MSDSALFLGGRVAVHHGDSREVLKGFPDGHFHAVVCDPPYALVSIVKRFGGKDAAPARDGDVYARASAGFMGQTWDTGETAFAAEFWREVLRVLKPGGWVIAASGTRTYHRLAVAIEDAGFEIRDMVSWLYGTGFPKSHDVAKGIDRHLGAEPVVVGQGAPVKRMIPGADQARDGWEKANGRVYVPVETRAATDEAGAWEGWGTALKPACEPWVLARKPLIGTVAENVLAHGTGALNVDGCRVATDEDRRRSSGGGDNGLANTGTFKIRQRSVEEQSTSSGRWPANVLHDGSDEVIARFPQTASGEGAVKRASAAGSQGNAYGKESRPAGTMMASYGDAGSAARFFFSAKADGEDRFGSKHPTVKPVDLMQYLVRLVTPPGGTVLDPFAGSGTTGEAAWREGFSAVLIEREAAFIEDIHRRLTYAASGPDERRHARVKASGKAVAHGDLPLFAEGGA